MRHSWIIILLCALCLGASYEYEDLDMLTNSLLNVGAVSGSDVDISAGTGDYLSTGIMGTGVLTVTEDVDGAATLLILTNDHEVTPVSATFKVDKLGNMVFDVLAGSIFLLPEAGGNVYINQATGALLFNSGEAVNIGTASANRPDNIWAKTNITAGDNIFASDGAAGSPSHSFTSDPLSGMYLANEGQIAFATDGAVKFSIQNTATATATFAAGIDVNLTASGTLTTGTGGLDATSGDIRTTGNVGIGQAAQSNERLSILMSATDTAGIMVDGDTNPFIYTGGAYIPNQFLRTINDSGSPATSLATSTLSETILTFNADLSGSRTIYNGKAIIASSVGLNYSGDIIITSGATAANKTYTMSGGRFTGNYSSGTITLDPGSAARQTTTRVIAGEFSSGYSPAAIVNTQGIATHQNIAGTFETFYNPAAITMVADSLTLETIGAQFKGKTTGLPVIDYTAGTATFTAIGADMSSINTGSNLTGQSDLPTTAIAGRFEASGLDTNLAIEVVAGDTILLDTFVTGLNFNSATELTISSGAVTVTQGHHSIDTESDDANDDLDTINGGNAGEILLILPADDNRTVRIRHAIGNIYLKHQVESKSYSFSSPAGSSGIFYSGGYYNWESLDANLTQASPSVTHSAANSSSACHIGIVAGGAGVVDTGVIKLTISGTTIDDEGNRLASQTVILVADITTLSLNQYVETTEKWIGQVTIALATASGSPVNFNLDINYGCSKYEDFGNQAFTINVVEVVGLAGANDTGFNLRLFHHSSANWTFAATGFVPGGTVLANMNTDHSTESDLANGESFAYKRVDLNTDISGDDSEGLILEITTSANKAVEIMDIHFTVHTAPNFSYMATTKQHLIFMKHGPNWLEL